MVQEHHALIGVPVYPLGHPAYLAGQDEPWHDVGDDEDGVTIDVTEAASAVTGVGHGDNCVGMGVIDKTKRDDGDSFLGDILSWLFIRITIIRFIL